MIPKVQEVSDALDPIPVSKRDCGAAGHDMKQQQHFRHTDRLL